MTWTLARHLIGLGCLAYITTAGYEVHKAGGPIEIDWLIKVLFLLVVATAIGTGPELFNWWRGVKSKRSTPSIFNTPDNPPARPVNPPPIPSTVADNTDNTGADMAKSATSRTSLIVSLIQQTKDPAIVQSLIKLQDDMFREAFKVQMKGPV